MRLRGKYLDSRLLGNDEKMDTVTPEQTGIQRFNS